MSRRRIKMTSGLRPGGVPGGILSGIIKAMADGGGPRRNGALEAEDEKRRDAEYYGDAFKGLMFVVFILFGLPLLLAGAIWVFIGAVELFQWLRA